MDKKTCFTAETIQTRLSANPFAKLSDIVLDIIQEAIINLDIRHRGIPECKPGPCQGGDQRPCKRGLRG